MGNPPWWLAAWWLTAARWLAVRWLAANGRSGLPPPGTGRTLEVRHESELRT
jgi:hypothetical protein